MHSTSPQLVPSYCSQACESTQHTACALSPFTRPLRPKKPTSGIREQVHPVFSRATGIKGLAQGLTSDRIILLGTEFKPTTFWTWAQIHELLTYTPPLHLSTIHVTKILYIKNQRNHKLYNYI